MCNNEDEYDLERNLEQYWNLKITELSKTTVGKTFTTTNKASVDSNDDAFNYIENFKPIDININTLKNVMDSYESQIGGSGPVSNLLNAMGIGISNLATN